MNIGEYFDWRPLIYTVNVKCKKESQIWGIRETILNIVNANYLPQFVDIEKPVKGYVICPVTLNSNLIEIIKNDPLDWEGKFEKCGYEIDWKIENMIEKVKDGEWSLNKLEEKLQLKLHQYIDNVVMEKNKINE